MNRDHTIEPSPWPVAMTARMARRYHVRAISTGYVLDAHDDEETARVTCAMLNAMLCRNDGRGMDNFEVRDSGR